MGFLKPQAGMVYIGPSAKPAYFDQEHQGLNLDNTVLNEIVYQYSMTIEEARTHLARFLFYTEDLERRIGSLSGGEKGRLSLLKLTLDKGNFLVLDEPTNHLDIQTREIMEDYLADYPGTILMVSHDRYFIDSIADRVLELSAMGLTSYPGNYTDYKERKERFARQQGSFQAENNFHNMVSNKPQTRASSSEAMSGQVSFDQESSDQASRPKASPRGKSRVLDRYEKARLRQRLKDLESEIASLEREESLTTSMLSDPKAYSGEDAGETIKGLNDCLNYIHARLPEALSEWEEVGRLLEE